MRGDGGLKRDETSEDVGMISIEEARARVLDECNPLPAERLQLREAFNHVVAEDIVATVDVPSFDNSAMDGFALREEDTEGASAAAPSLFRVVEVIPAGKSSDRTLGPGEAVKIMTGAPLPKGADTVVPWEEVDEEDGRLFVSRSLERGKHVRGAGEDLRAGEVVIPRGERLGPAQIGVLASLGAQEVLVHRHPRVAVVATGSELVELGREPTAGQIHDSNSYVALAQCSELQLEAERLGIAADDFQTTFELMRRGLEYDVLITSGGVSVGEFDFVKEVQEKLGVERRLWGVAMKPGKPLAFGVKDGTLVFGVPGNPGAAIISFELFIRPALLRLMGHSRVVRPVRRAILEEDFVNRGDRTRVLRAVARSEGSDLFVRSAGAQGSGVLKTMARANALIFVSTDLGGAREGEAVDCVLLRDELVEP
jgi:molybdopterin molybdotransferase